MIDTLWTIGFTPLDIAALVLFGVVWFGYERLLHWIGRRYGTINFTMRLVRRHWMEAMVRREVRIADAALLGHVMNSTAFFASTTVLVAAAMVGALANLDTMQPAIERLDFTAKTTRALFELKVLLPLIVFVGGFFRFTWSLRQFNYAIAMIGATPPPADTQAGDGAAMADQTAEVMTSAAEAFNGGIRSYYFALACLFWFGGPLAFILATLVVVWTLLRRQVTSRAAKAIRSEASKLTKY